MEKKRKTKRLVLYERKTYRRLLINLAANIQRLRDELGLTQEEAAHRCSMPTRQWQVVESGEANATLITVARLCDGLGVSIGELFATATRKR